MGVSMPPTANDTADDGRVPEAPAPYDFTIDLQSDSTHAKVVRLIGPGKRVLELGPATGYMSRVLQERGCRVVGIELNPAMAARAAAFCERIIAGDLESLDLERELGDDRFDAIVAADVLEHLRDPLAILRRLKPYLCPNGVVVASLPNVAHGSVRLALLGGRFPYGERGLLDRTHLRFYTREGIESLFEEAGLAIGHLERQLLEIVALQAHLQEVIAVKDRHIAEQDRHTAQLQAALDRILYSAPGRLYRRARAILSLGRR